MQLTYPHSPFFKLIILAFISITLAGCNSEKRLLKAKMGLESGMEGTRPWPYNYNFTSYCNQFDNANGMLATCKQKEEEARKAKNESVQKVMKQNIEHYEKDIKRLKADKEFYKVYKLHVRVTGNTLANEAKATKSLEKQKRKDEKAAAKQMQGIANKNAQDKKARDASIKQQRKALDARKK